MTWKSEPLKIKNKSKAKPITPEQLAASGSEDGEQAAVMCWAALNTIKYPQLKWLHAIPNGGSRHIAEATKMVATGSRSGVWDLFLPMPIQTNFVKQYAGLYIEMKKSNRRNHKNGGLSDEQLEFGWYAESVGYFCSVCYNWNEAVDTLIKYMEGEV